METRDIKVYGTLVNYTVDDSIGDKDLHNDKLAFARQLYDDQFGQSKKVNNFQDIINKRIQKVKRNDDGDTVIEGDLIIEEGDIFITVDGEKVSLKDIYRRLKALEKIWKISGEYIVPASDVEKVKAGGFWDTTVN